MQVTERVGCRHGSATRHPWLTDRVGAVDKGGVQVAPGEHRVGVEGVLVCRGGVRDDTAEGTDRVGTAARSRIYQTSA